MKASHISYTRHAFGWHICRNIPTEVQLDNDLAWGCQPVYTAGDVTKLLYYNELSRLLCQNAKHFVFWLVVRCIRNLPLYHHLFFCYISVQYFSQMLHLNLNLSRDVCLCIKYSKSLTLQKFFQTLLCLLTWDFSQRALENFKISSKGNKKRCSLVLRCIVGFLRELKFLSSDFVFETGLTMPDTLISACPWQLNKRADWDAPHKI